MSLHPKSEWFEHLSQIAARARFAEPERYGFVVRTAVGAEEDVHERRNVGVVAGPPVAVVVPVMELGRADQHAQGTDR